MTIAEEESLPCRRSMAFVGGDRVIVILGSFSLIAHVLTF